MIKNIKNLQKVFSEECDFAKLMRKANRFAHMRYHYLIALKTALSIKDEYIKSENQKEIENWNMLIEAVSKNIEVDYDFKEIKEIDAYNIFTKSVFEVVTSKSLGTCFLVDKKDGIGYFVTNRHVVEKSTYVRIVSNDKVVDVNATIEDMDKNYDIALIKASINNDNIVPVTFADPEEVHEGVKLYIVGNRSGLGLGFITGFVASFLNENIMMSMKTEHGTSGSSVFDVYGSVIGLNCGIMGEVPYCISEKVIIDYLKRFNLKIRMTPKVKYN